MRPVLFLALLSLIWACQPANGSQPQPPAPAPAVVQDTPPPPPAPLVNRDSLLALPDSAWVDMQDLLPDALYEIRYASTNNFMKTQVYPCGKCFLRLALAKALMQAQKGLDSLKLRYKFFDCYRPSDAQHALWKIVPDARYVTPPARGSMHSRGMAVDLTLVDAQGQELDMGTEFDFFGQPAYWSYTPKHSKTVQQNRKILRTSLEAVGFKTVTTEWWHYNYSRASFKLSNMQWPCS
jgi:D-alanyl-D-alanine dipeptidase